VTAIEVSRSRDAPLVNVVLGVLGVFGGNKQFSASLRLCGKKLFSALSSCRTVSRRTQFAGRQ